MGVWLGQLDKCAGRCPHQKMGSDGSVGGGSPFGQPPESQYPLAMLIGQTMGEGFGFQARDTPRHFTQADFFSMCRRSFGTAPDVFEPIAVGDNVAPPVVPTARHSLDGVFNPNFNPSRPWRPGEFPFPLSILTCPPSQQKSIEDCPKKQPKEAAPFGDGFVVLYKLGSRVLEVDQTAELHHLHGFEGFLKEA